MFAEHLWRGDAQHAAQSDAGVWLPYFLSLLGAAYIQAGRLDDAREALNEGSAFAEKSNARLDNVLKVGSRIAERLISSPDDVKVDAGGAAHPDCCCGTCAEINRAAPNERSAIIDPHYH